MEKTTKRALRSIVEKIDAEEILVVLNAIKTGELQVENMIQTVEKERQREPQPGMLYQLYPDLYDEDE